MSRNFSDYLNGAKILFVDLFHGHVILFSPDDGSSLPDSFHANITGDSRILLTGTTTTLDKDYHVHVLLLEPNFITSGFRIVSQVESLVPFPIYSDSQILMNQSIPNSFICFNANGYILVELHGDRIIIGEHTTSNLEQRLACMKFDGNKLFGISRYVAPGKIHLCAYDLQTMKEQNTAISSAPDTGSAYIHHDWHSVRYTWSKNILYVSFHQLYKIFRLDASTGLWSTLDYIVCGRICNLYVIDDVLIVHVSGRYEPDNDERCFYRFPLRRPETLANLAWFTILHQRNFHGSQIYECVNRRLPYNSYLRCPFPEAE